MRTTSSILVSVLAAIGLAACQTTSSDSSAPADRSRSGSRPGGILGAFKPEPLVVPQGTTLSVALETALSSASNRPGDLVVARLAHDLRLGDKVVLPAGTELRGRVTAAVPSGRVKTRAHLAWDFDQLVVHGKAHAIEAQALDITARDTRRRDGAIVAGGAGAGAILGAIVDGKKGAGLGALLGAGAGTGVILTNKGNEVEVPAGSALSLKLTREVQLG